MFSQRQQPSRPVESVDRLPPGAVVLVKGLRAGEHNGQQGRVNGWSGSRQRYNVTLAGVTTVLLKPENIQQIVEGCEIFALSKRPELNGLGGVLVDFEPERRRVILRLDASREGVRTVAVS